MSSGSQTPSQALLSAPLLSSVDDEACCELVGDHLAPGAIVFFITITQSPTDRLSVYREYGPDDTDVSFELIAVDNQNTATELDADSVREGSEDLTITTVRSARDLTRLGLAINKRLREVDESRPVTVCFHSLTSLLQFVEEDIAFRFIHTLNGVIESHNGSIHYHIDSNAHSPEVMGTFRPLFDTVVDGDDIVRTKRDMEKVKETSQRPPAIELEPSTDTETDTREAPSASASTGSSEPTEEFDTSEPFTLDVEEVSEPLSDSDTPFDPDPDATPTADSESMPADAEPTPETNTAASAATSTPASDNGSETAAPDIDPFSPESAGTSPPDTDTTTSSSTPQQNKPLPELGQTDTADSEPTIEYDAAFGAAEARRLLLTRSHRIAEGAHPLPIISSHTSDTSTNDPGQLSSGDSSDDALADWEWVTDTVDGDPTDSAGTQSALDSDSDSDSDFGPSVETVSAATTDDTTAAAVGTDSTDQATASTEEPDSGHAAASRDRTGTETQSAVEANADADTDTTTDVGFIAQTVLGIVLLVAGITIALQGEALFATAGIAVTALLPATISLTPIGAVVGAIGAIVLFLR